MIHRNLYFGGVCQEYIGIIGIGISLGIPAELSIHRMNVYFVRVKMLSDRNLFFTL